MAHNVFISYASQDKTVADAVCANLESHGVRCWIAPRDVLPGMNWAASIIEAIHSARVMVLVFSESSNRSSQVAREVERAANRELPMVPFRIQNVLPSDAMEYFLGTPHWLDAMSPPLERHLQQLETTVQALLNRTAPPPPVPGPVPVPPVPRPAPGPGLWTRINSGPYRWLFAGGAACFAALVAVAIYLLIRPPAPPHLTPQQIYAVLTNQPVNPSEFPPGISLDQIYSQDVETDNAKYGAIGEVTVDLKSANVPALPNKINNAYVIYVIFPKDADAAGRLSEYSFSSTVPGVKQPSKCYNDTDTVSDTKLGVTACVVQSGPVLAFAESRIAGSQQQQGSSSDAEGLARFALAHLAAVEASSPTVINAAVAANPTAASTSPTAAPTGTARPATPVATAVVTPVATLPGSISVTYEDATSRLQANTADRDIRTILAHLEVDDGLVPVRPLGIHFFSDATSAQQGMNQLGVDATTINSLLSGDLAANVSANGNNIIAVVYLPSADDLQGILAFCLSSYTLRVHGAFDTDDAYPYWFLRGFENYTQTRFTDNGFNQLPTAVQDVKAGTAPALSSISANSDAQNFINGQNNGSDRLDARGQAAVEFLAAQYGNAAVARLLRDGPFASIAAFNTDLQGITKQTPTQFNAALNDWLQSSQGGGP